MLREASYTLLVRNMIVDDNCWFTHSESFKKSKPSFKCNFCQQKFKTTNSLRKHMKSLHIQSVSNCKNEDECRFGHRKCWFLHKEDIEIAFKNAKGKSNDKNVSHDME